MSLSSISDYVFLEGLNDLIKTSTVYITPTKYLLCS